MTVITIEAMQVWIIGPGSPKPMRKIRLLAKYPDGGLQTEDDLWIYEELPGGVARTEIGCISVFPTFNLRYMISKDMAVLES